MVQNNGEKVVFHAIALFDSLLAILLPQNSPGAQ